MKPVVTLFGILLLSARETGTVNFYYKSAEPEDFLIGALLPVHQSPETTKIPSRACGAIWGGPGVQRVEAALQAIDDINSRSDILPNSILGVQIRDSCGYSPIGLEQASRMATLSAWQDTEYLDQPYPYTRRELDECDSEEARNNLIAVIGPSSTSGAADIQSLLVLFGIPHVGYDFTGQDIGLRERNGSYVNIVRTNQAEAQAMVSVVAYFNWTYISTAYTNVDGSSRAGVEEFTSRASRIGICVSQSLELPLSAPEADFRNAVQVLRKTPRARVVVCFCDTITVIGLLKAIKEENATQEFSLVVSDTWSTDTDMLRGLEDEADGTLALRQQVYQDASFESYFVELKPSTNTRDPWFCEYWEESFQCNINQPTCYGGHNRSCKGHETLRKDYIQDPKVTGVKEAIYLVADALDQMITDHCADGSSGDCARQMRVTSSKFLEYLDNAARLTGNGSVRIQQSVQYDVINVQKLGKSKLDFVRVATWDNNVLTFLSNPNWKKGESETPQSSCSSPCSKGQVKVPESGTSLCCWDCVRCSDSQYVATEYACGTCPWGTWPNPKLDGCRNIPPKYVKWTEASTIVVGIFCMIVIIATCFVLAIYIRHVETPVIKASSRELSFVILFGILSCNASSFTMIMKPTPVVCFFERFIPAFSVATVHAAIFTRTNRIARILAVGDDKIFSRNHRFMSTTSQLSITALLILGQVVISGTMLLLQPPGVELYYPDPNHVILVCDTTLVASVVGLSYDFLLIVLCACYAVKTRNVPENFNDAKMIGFAMYAAVVIWIAYIAVYVGSEQNQKLALCLAMCFSSATVLAFLFIPKVYLILFQPHKNKRTMFLTFKKDMWRQHVVTVAARIVNDTPQIQSSRDRAS